MSLAKTRLLNSASIFLLCLLFGGIRKNAAGMGRCGSQLKVLQ